MRPSSSVIAYLSIGSNLGDRLENLRQACRALDAAGIRLLRCSSVYETEPVDFLDQPWFLNCVVEVETALEPAALLRELQKIENDLGRQRQQPAWQPKGPRIIDLDILLYGDVMLDDGTVILPHPRMLQRGFVMLPLREIAPSLCLPGSGKTVEEVSEELHDSAVVRVFRKSLFD